MTRVFITYPNAKTPFAMRINAALVERGYETWIFARDGKVITGDYSTAIDTAMAESDVQVVIANADNIASPNIRIEMRRFSQANKPIIPLLLEPLSLPDEIDKTRAVHYLDNFNGAVDQLAAQIDRVAQETTPTQNDLILISYPRAETAFAQRLDSALRVEGFKTWLYARDYDPAQEREPQVRRAIQVAALQIVVVTQHALRASSNMRFEYEAMAALGKPIIPALVYPVTDLPEPLRGVKPIDFQGDFAAAFDHLLAAIAKAHPAETAPPTAYELAQKIESKLQPDADAPVLDRELSHHIFLSYKRMDGEVMRRVRDDLMAAGFVVWTDELIEKGTPQWQREIERAIRNTAMLVCLLSPEAAQSDYVREELAAAKLFKKPVFLALIRGTREQCFIYGYVNAQTTDLRDETAYQREFPLLVEAIRKQL